MSLLSDALLAARGQAPLIQNTTGGPSGGAKDALAAALAGIRGDAYARALTGSHSASPAVQLGPAGPFSLDPGQNTMSPRGMMAQSLTPDGPSTGALNYGSIGPGLEKLGQGLAAAMKNAGQKGAGAGMHPGPGPMNMAGGGAGGNAGTGTGTAGAGTGVGASAGAANLPSANADDTTKFLHGIGTVESGNRYLPTPNAAGAGGRYQMTQGFLDHYAEGAGVPGATVASIIKDPAAQDKIATYAANRMFQNGDFPGGNFPSQRGDWSKVANGWFTGSPTKVASDVNMPSTQYVSKVMAAAGIPATGTPRDTVASNTTNGYKPIAGNLSDIPGAMSQFGPSTGSGQAPAGVLSPMAAPAGSGAQMPAPARNYPDFGSVAKTDPTSFGASLPSGMRPDAGTLAFPGAVAPAGSPNLPMLASGAPTGLAPAVSAYAGGTPGLAGTTPSGIPLPPSRPANLGTPAVHAGPAPLAYLAAGGYGPYSADQVKTAGTPLNKPGGPVSAPASSFLRPGDTTLGGNTNAATYAGAGGEGPFSPDQVKSAGTDLNAYTTQAKLAAALSNPAPAAAAPNPGLLASALGGGSAGLVPDGQGGWVPSTNSRYNPATGDFLPAAGASSGGYSPISGNLSDIPGALSQTGATPSAGAAPSGVTPSTPAGSSAADALQDAAQDAGYGKQGPALATLPGVNTAKVDPRLLDSVTNGAQYLPKGYTVRVNEGWNPDHGDTGSQHRVAGSGALDVQIIDPQGNELPNRGNDKTGMYTQLAQHTYGSMAVDHPELNGQLGWGGNFGTSGANPEQADLMHFDIGGDRGHLGDPLSTRGFLNPGGDQISPQPQAMDQSQFQPQPVADMTPSYGGGYQTADMGGGGFGIGGLLGSIFG